jgi:hypothetical protein
VNRRFLVRVRGAVLREDELAREGALVSGWIVELQVPVVRADEVGQLGVDARGAGRNVEGEFDLARGADTRHARRWLKLCLISVE